MKIDPKCAMFKSEIETLFLHLLTKMQKYFFN
jgi:hypothetical protein